MELSIRVTAHYKRREWAEGLSAELDCPIVWDERNNVWDTHRRALLQGTGDYLLVVQDDAILSEGLVDSVNQAIRYADGDPISLYAWPMKVVTEISSLRPETWWRMVGPLFGVAVVLPVEDLERIVAFGDTVRWPMYDKRLWKWYESQGRLCRYTYPCLVEHRDAPSLMWANTRRPDRRALAFGSGANLDWTVPPLEATPEVLHPQVVLTDGHHKITVRKDSAAWRRRTAAGWEVAGPGVEPGRPGL